MKAIVDPWLIYVLSIVDGIKCFSWIFFSILIIAIVILAIATWNSYDIINCDDRVNYSTKEYYKKAFKRSHKWLIISIILFILNLIMIILVPSKNTIQEMIDTTHPVESAITDEYKEKEALNENSEIKIIISK